MRDSVQEEIRRAAEAAEETFQTPEEAEAQLFMTEFAPAQVTAAKLAELKAKYTGLKIMSVEDRKTYDLVHAGRMEIRAFRGEVERVRKRLKEDSLAWGRKVDSEAKRLTTLLLEIEGPLAEEEERIDAEKEAIRAQKQREKDAELQRRIDALTAVGHPVNVGDLASMPATTYAMVLQTATEAFEVRERERKAAEAALVEKRAEEERKAREEAEAKAKAEAEDRARLEKERVEQAAEAKRLEEARAALRREQEEFEARKRAQEQAAREEQIRKEAAERARLEAERKTQEEKERREREAREAAEKAERERVEAEARRKAQEAARPDAEKLRDLAETLRGTAFPKMATGTGEAARLKIQEAMTKFVKFIENEANTLAPRTMA